MIRTSIQAVLFRSCRTRWCSRFHGKTPEGERTEKRPTTGETG